MGNPSDDKDRQKWYIWCSRGSPEFHSGPDFALNLHLDPQSMSNNCLKPSKIAETAIVLHTFGLQAITIEDAIGEAGQAAAGPSIHT